MNNSSDYNRTREIVEKIYTLIAVDRDNSKVFECCQKSFTQVVTVIIVLVIIGVICKLLLDTKPDIQRNVRNKADQVS